MIGSYVLGASIFLKSDSIYSVVFDVKIKNSESLLTLEHNSGIRAKSYSL